jgi:hypothetical protein
LDGDFVGIGKGRSREVGENKYSKSWNLHFVCLSRVLLEVDV